MLEAIFAIAYILTNNQFNVLLTPLSLNMRVRKIYYVSHYSSCHECTQFAIPVKRADQPTVR